MNTSNITAMGKANVAQMSQALIVQAYANSVIAQPDVDFGNNEHIKGYQNTFNGYLTTARGHAKYYLDTLQCQIIDCMGNIGNYFELNKVLPIVCPEGSSVQDWINNLDSVRIEAGNYKNQAENLVVSLKSFRSDLGTDSSNFKDATTKLNAAVSGDNGELSKLEGDLDSLQSKIDGSIAGIVLGSLAVVGGAIMIAVGAVSTAVTGGAATAVVLGGIGFVVTGVGGVVAGSVALASLSDQRGNMLQKKSTLETEIKLATTINSSFDSLVRQVDAAIEAVSQMCNAWEFLISDINGIINDLKAATITPGQVKSLFVAAANAEIAKVLGDIETIKGQMAGVSVVTLEPGQTIADYLKSVAA